MSLEDSTIYERTYTRYFNGSTGVSLTKERHGWLIRVWKDEDMTEAKFLFNREEAVECAVQINQELLTEARARSKKKGA